MCAVCSPTRNTRKSVALSDHRLRDKAEITGAGDAPADQRLFAIEDAAWTEFLAMLERPASHKPRLTRLLAEPSPFDEA
ncbi:hypothetical protein A7G45_09070 [Mycolicibacterium llatzerense]|nr:hypothetical protein [Mycolicibacterium llatzerense]